MTLSIMTFAELCALQQDLCVRIFELKMPIDRDVSTRRRIVVARISTDGALDPGLAGTSERAHAATMTERAMTAEFRRRPLIGEFVLRVDRHGSLLSTVPLELRSKEIPLAVANDTSFLLLTRRTSCQVICFERTAALGLLEPKSAESL
jgi:hypothetical protein